MASKEYKKGYAFEKRVQKYLENQGYYVFRNPKSAFPDLLAIMPATTEQIIDKKTGEICPGYVSVSPERLIECKNWKKVPKDPLKQLSKEEIQQFKELRSSFPLGKFLLAYNDNRKIKFVEVPV